MPDSNSEALLQILAGIEDLKTRVSTVNVNVTQSQSQVQTVMRAMEHSAPAREKSPDDNDPHKGNFGGSFVNHGWYFSATATPVTDPQIRDGLQDHQILRFKVAQLQDGEPAQNATFFLHPSFPNPRVTIPVKDGIATLEVMAWGAFTAGCRLDDSNDRLLELDLSQRVTDAPADWRSR